jgi:hypothetical protein
VRVESGVRGLREDALEHRAGRPDHRGDAELDGLREPPPSSDRGAGEVAGGLQRDRADDEALRVVPRGAGLLGALDGLVGGRERGRGVVRQQGDLGGDPGRADPGPPRSVGCVRDAGRFGVRLTCGVGVALADGVGGEAEEGVDERLTSSSGSDRAAVRAARSKSRAAG